MYNMLWSSDAIYHEFQSPLVQLMAWQTIACTNADNCWEHQEHNEMKFECICEEEL